MPKKKKKAYEMTDKELLHDLFPKEVIRALKDEARKHLKKRKKGAKK